MKKHEQQTSRLEKISDFFGVSNFLRLNNFHLNTKLLALIIASQLQFSASEVFATEAEKNYYSRELSASVDGDAIRKFVIDSLSVLKTELPDIKIFIKQAMTEKHILADAFAKRLEITNRLAAYLEKLLKSDSHDALLYARQGASELKQLLVYFKEAEARARFLKNAPPETVINVRNFGAKGDGVQNDTPAFVQAVEQVKKTKGRVKLFIPAGTYLFGNYEAKRTFPADADGWRVWSPDYERKYEHLFIPRINNVNDLTIEGEKGSMLLSSDPRLGFFSFQRCHYLTIRNLTFDYKQLPFTQGMIMEVDRDKRIVRLKLDDGFPAPDLDYFLTPDSFYGILYNSAGENIKGASFQRIGAVKDIGDGLYDLKFLRAPHKHLTPGCKLVINARYGSIDGHIMKGRFCNHTLIDGVTVHASPACAFGGFVMSDYAVVNSRILPPEGSGRLQALNADPCMIGNGAIGPYLANNIFEHAGDDVANQFVGAMQIKSIAEDGRSIVVTWGDFSPGDVISLLSPNDGEIKGETRIKTVSNFAYGLLTLTLDTAFPADIPTLDSLNKKAILSKKENHNFNKMAAVTSDPIPCTVLNRSHTGSGTVFLNNTFRHSYRGILIKVSNALLEGNTIEGMDREALSIMIYAHFWRESNAPHNVVVRNNIFRNNGGVSSYYEIHLHKIAPGLTPIRDILFENNVFENTSARFDNCKDVKLIGNKFDVNSWIQLGMAREVLIEGNSFALPEKQALKIDDAAKNVTINTNTFVE